MAICNCSPLTCSRKISRSVYLLPVDQEQWAQKIRERKSAPGAASQWEGVPSFPWAYSVTRLGACKILVIELGQTLKMLVPCCARLAARDSLLCTSYIQYVYIHIYIHIYIRTFVLDLGCVHMREIVSEIASILDWQHKFRAATCEVGLHRSLTFPISDSPQSHQLQCIRFYTFP